MMKANYVYGIIFLLIQVCNTVRITNLKVPSTYIIENPAVAAKNGKSAIGDNQNHLILDCEYEIEPREKGFVLKWFLNNQSIYQWIPTRAPFATLSFKSHINTTYRASEDDRHRHRAMAVTRPMWNITGEYACSVQTFQSNDRKSAFLQIIVPEADFQLNYRTDYEGFVNIRCYASEISPEPQIQIILSNNGTLDLSTTSKKGTNGLFRTTVVGKISKEQITPETTINCILSIAGTNYTRKRETIYYEQQPMSSESELDDVAGGIFSLGIESKQNAGSSWRNPRNFGCALVMILFVIFLNIA